MCPDYTEPFSALTSARMKMRALYSYRSAPLVIYKTSNQNKRWWFYSVISRRSLVSLTLSWRAQCLFEVGEKSPGSGLKDFV